MTASALIVAAGSGTRAGGDLPKQWQDFLGRPLADWSVAALSGHPGIAFAALVVAPEWLDFARTRYAAHGIAVTAGGETRAQSVRAGLAMLPADSAVLVHDAARPGLSHAMIDALLAALEDHDGAAPALPVIDALKREEQGVLRNVDRSALYRIQTPQAFRAGILARALSITGADLVDDFEAAEAIGAHLTLIPGDEALMKITHPADFDLAARLIAPLSETETRTGHGFDVHAFEPGPHITLCGVDIPHSHRLQGHSDADAGWHALTDAILGAASLGDIGDHFPPSDPQWKGAPSDLFLRHAVGLASAQGWRLVHADVTLICEAPKIKPHREAMRARTAEVCGLPLEAVSVKATTTEMLGFTGRREGLAAMATATLSRRTVPGKRA